MHQTRRRHVRRCGRFRSTVAASVGTVPSGVRFLELHQVDPFGDIVFPYLEMDDLSDDIDTVHWHDLAHRPAGRKSSAGSSVWFVGDWSSNRCSLAVGARARRPSPWRSRSG